MSYALLRVICLSIKHYARMNERATIILRTPFVIDPVHKDVLLLVAFVEVPKNAQFYLFTANCNCDK